MTCNPDATGGRERGACRPIADIVGEKPAVVARTVWGNPKKGKGVEMTVDRGRNCGGSAPTAEARPCDEETVELAA